MGNGGSRRVMGRDGERVVAQWTAAALKSHFLDLNGKQNVAMDEADVVDPMPAIEKECHVPCVKAWKIYEECVKRIEGDETGDKHCTGYYFDYWTCNHHCVRLQLLEPLRSSTIH